jgi:hypothetical protein
VWKEADVVAVKRDIEESYATKENREQILLRAFTTLMNKL